MRHIFAKWAIDILFGPPVQNPSRLRQFLCTMTRHWASWVVNGKCTTCHKG